MDLLTKNWQSEANTTLCLLKQEGDHARILVEDAQSIEEGIDYCLASKFLEKFSSLKAVREMVVRWNTPHKMLAHHSL